MQLLLARLRQLVGAENRAQVIKGVGEVVVDQQVVVLDIVAHLFSSCGNTFLNHLCIILSALVQSLAKGLFRGRQDKDAGAVGEQFAHLSGTLPIDFENYIFATGQNMVYTAKAYIVCPSISANNPNRFYDEIISIKL